MAAIGPRRFYDAVTVVDRADHGYGVQLDGRAVKSPLGAELAVPGATLAEAIAREWRAQDARIEPGTMPLTQLAFTAIDRIGRERRAIVAGVAKYGETDLICYRASAPEDLVARQAAAWDPLLDWAAETLNARLNVTAGVLPVDQPEAALAALRGAADNLDDWRLTALVAVTQAAGSLVIGLALVSGFLDAPRAVQASQLDDAYQGEKWGEDNEARARLTALEREISEAETFLNLLT